MFLTTLMIYGYRHSLINRKFIFFGFSILILTTSLFYSEYDKPIHSIISCTIFFLIVFHLVIQIQKCSQITFVQKNLIFMSFLLMYFSLIAYQFISTLNVIDEKLGVYICILLNALSFTLFSISLKFRMNYKRKHEYFSLTHDQTSNLPNINFLKIKLNELFNSHQEFTLCAIEIYKYSSYIPYITYDEKKTFHKKLTNIINAQLMTENVFTLEPKSNSKNLACLKEGVFAFVILNNNECEINNILNCLINKIQHTYTFNYFKINIEVKFGTCTYPNDSHQFDSLINKSFQALNESRTNSNPIHKFDALNSFNRQMHMSLVNDLKNAIEENNLELFHQPQISLKNNKIHGSELLVRWNHPKFGFIPPETFISLAEEVGLIHELTKWVLNEAFKQQRILLSQGIFNNFSVNISAHDISQVSFTSDICRLAKLHNVPMHFLSIELTESALVSDLNSLKDLMLELKQFNINVSIDDYGTGYSSLSYLSKLPFSELKIDRDFIRNISSDIRLQKIVKATTEMAKSLDLIIVAEGVETPETISLLRAYGVDICQGFYYSKPLPFNDFIHYMHVNESSFAN